jgi:transcriptional regulator with XRE-family HTH domain
MSEVQTPPASRARELGDLLRARRERLQPADVGIAAGSRRRTPGLRREEVAMLAAISATYYAFLEQGREVRPSRHVLDSLAQALQLSPAERAHVHELVYGEHAAAAHGVAETAAPAVVALVDRLDPHPTYVTGRRFDVLAANRAARLMWTDWTKVPLDERNMLWWTFTAPAARDVFVEWRREAAASLARFRAAADRHRGDAAFDQLSERLKAVSPEVRAWWPRHDVAPTSSGTKRLRHPQLGEITFAHVVMHLADDPEQKLVTFSADDRDQRRIARLLESVPAG